VTPSDLMSETTYDHMFRGQSKFHTADGARGSSAVPQAWERNAGRAAWP